MVEYKIFVVQFPSIQITDWYFSLTIKIYTLKKKIYK